MIAFFFSFPSIAFTVAALLVVLLLALEVIFLKLGGSTNVEIDADHLDALGVDFLGWLGFGKVPMLVLVVVGLASFSMIGFSVQTVGNIILPLKMAAWLAVPVAAVGALISMRVLGPFFGRLMPKNESYAVERGQFIGHVAEVSEEVVNLTVGRSFEVKLKDQYGTTHYFTATLPHEVQRLPRGQRVLILAATEFGFQVILEDKEAV